MRPPQKGVTATTEDELCAFTATPDTVSVRYGDWPVFSLPREEAYALLPAAQPESPIPSPRHPVD